MELLISLAMKFWMWSILIIVVIIGSLINLLDKKKPRCYTFKSDKIEITPTERNHKPTKSNPRQRSAMEANKMQFKPTKCNKKPTKYNEKLPYMCFKVSLGGFNHLKTSKTT